MNSIDETAFAATFGYIDTSEYYAAPELEGSGTLFWNALYLNARGRRAEEYKETVMKPLNPIII